MHKDISIKEFRAQLAEIADRIEAGESFRVIRRSKPVFIAMKVGEVDDDDLGKWETVVDFTEGGKKEGMLAEDVLDILDEVHPD